MERGFWTIPKPIAERKDMSLKAKLIAGLLWSMRKAKQGVFPSRSYMAEALGVSTATVDRGLKELKEKAGVKIKRRGFGRTNLYLIPEWSESSEMPTTERAGKTDHEEAKVRTVKKTRLRNIVDTPNRDINRKGTEVDDGKSSSVKEIFHYFKSRVREAKGFEPEISWGKEGRLIKLRLKRYSSEQIRRLIDWYLASNLSEKLGASLAVCLSTHVVNLWKASLSSQPYYPVFNPSKL